ncbi:PhnD/SsuA/transferrin family substrate-binding protein [Parasutterella sp.]|jgi:putative signal transduction histidine kinase|uniref:sensor histidine kinase n=2 Tax=Parasutterella sp. TaxID=2049037 RepID=UPI003520D7F1
MVLGSIARVLFLTALIAANAAPAFSKTITIGILDTIDPWFYVQTFGPTMEHLRKVIPQYEIKSVELSFEKLQKAIKAGELDFFIAPSGFFAYVAESAGARHIATRHPQGAKDPSKSVGSVFVVRANDSRFNNLSDLVKVSVAATDSNSFDGWIIALGELLLQNLDPKKMFSGITYTGYGIPDVASMVLNKQVDVGILKTCDLEQFERDGTIAKGALRVLNPKNDSSISCRVSTDLYPDVVFASLPKADSNLVKTVSVGLLTMEQTRGGDSWGFASDFTPVSSLYRSLEIGPYEYLKETGFTGFAKRYRHYLYGLAALLILILLYTASVRRIVSLRTRDLTIALKEKDKAEKEARESRENLFQLEKAGVVSELSAMFAHEAHQPIASLINYADGLKLYLKGKSEDPLVQEALSEISTQADRLSKIIQRVRTYAKRQHHEVKKENLSEIIDRALVSFRRSSISTGVDVEVKAPVTANLLADALELELLIVNLLKNAAAACRDSQDKIINVQLSEATNEWMLSVSDHGQVISDKLLSQLSHPTKSLSDGLGLGLSICRLIAESHGGKLTFKPNTPKGLVVTLHLPKVNEEN